MFESCGHNLDSTIKSLNDLCLSSGVEESTLASPGKNNKVDPQLKGNLFLEKYININVH